MTFTLKVAKSFYDSKSDEEEIAKLEALGFEFKDYDSSFDLGRDKYLSGSVKIEIGSLEDFMAFVKEWGEVIVDVDSIQIYNDYVE